MAGRVSGRAVSSGERSWAQRSVRVRSCSRVRGWCGAVAEKIVLRRKASSGGILRPAKESVVTGPWVREPVSM